MLNVIICGVNGAMGQVLKSTIEKQDDMQVIAGVDKFPDSMKNPFPVYQNIFECEGSPQVIIDFSRPEALHANLAYAQHKNCAIVIATTGYNGEQLADIRGYSKEIPVFMSANMSLGVNLQVDLIKRSAEFLGKAYDIEIIEQHHNKKVDAPSGTALMLANAINEVSLPPLDYVYDRHSHNYPRKENELGIHSIRGGTIAGVHEVHFIGNDEIVEVNHRALSKQVFAVGALRAAQYIVKKPKGLYSMLDIISEQNAITNIYTDEKQAIITIFGLNHDPILLADLFAKLAEEGVNIDMISQTAPENDKINLSFSLQLSKVTNALHTIGTFGEITNVKTDTAVTKISIEGLGMEYQSGVAAKVFRALKDIKVKLITTSETKIALCISKSETLRAVHALENLFLS